MSRRVRSYGSSAFLIECAAADVLGLMFEIRSRSLPGVLEIVPGERALLITLGGTADAESVESALQQLEPRTMSSTSGDEVSLSVKYDGPDLSEVASASQLSVDGVVALHSQATYRVAFCGFAPGFAYLTGIDERLKLPRRPSPRAQVPAGSLAIAADYTAVYPAASPGGWHLIGSCDEVLFDVTRDPPSVLSPGQVVHLEPR